jgi:hypothetical protein
MFDTVNLWLPMDEVRKFDLDDVLSQLESITEHSKPDGQTSFSGHLGGNYRLSISENGISLSGSLAKYFLPDNFHTLTRSDTQRAIEKLSDDLKLPINNAKVRRIDFAQNILTDYEPEIYYPYLGDCLNYYRLPQERSLYYSNSLRKMVFYNKVVEGKTKGFKLPEIWNSQNVLRFELRFISRLPKQFNRPDVIASTLSDEKFYIQMFDRWHSEYKNINKINKPNFNLENMNSPKDFIRQLALFAVQTIGQENIMQDIEYLRAKQIFDKPEYYSRLKKEIRELCNSPKLTESSDLINELDKKMKSAKMNYR